MGDARERGTAALPAGLATRARARRAALLRARVDAVTAEVVPALAAAGVRAIVLKGPATAALLHGPDSDRIYADSDLLVAPGDLARAGEVLAGLGMRCDFDERTFAADPHAQTWSRPGSPVVDLHWRLPGVPLDPGEAWRVLTAATEPLPVAGIEAEALDAAGRALHVAIHAAQHGRRNPTALADLELAVALRDGVWLAAWELARRLRAEAPFAAGLRRVPAGAELATRLGITGDGAGEWELIGGEAPFGAHAAYRTLGAVGPGAKLRVLVRGALPPPAAMRVNSALARRGRLGLVAAYAVRIGRAVRAAPAAVRAAARVRRGQRARAGRPT